MSHRWLIAAASVTTHVCLGSVYAWSVFLPSMQAQTGWTKPQLTWAFSLAIACLGLTAALAAPLMRRWGPRTSVAISGLFFGLGVTGAGAAILAHSLPGLYLAYGVVGGIGLGLGYVPPVTTLMRWFADRKGFATGMAVGGFGIGALLTSFLGEALLKRMDCGHAFLVLGPLFGSVILLASRVLALPQDTPMASPGTAEAASSPLREGRFWLLWSAFFLNIASGILLIALARPMLEESAKGAPTALSAVTAVAVMGLFNGLGRLGWSSLSDHAGRLPTWMAMFLLQGLVFFLLRGSPSFLVLALGLWVIASCYGGGFALCPALVADLFGTPRAAHTYGLALTAWSAAALISPPLGARMREITGSYTGVLGGCLLASLAGLVLMGMLRSSTRTTHQGAHTANP